MFITAMPHTFILYQAQYVQARPLKSPFNVLVTLNYSPILSKVLEQIRKESTKTFYFGRDSTDSTLIIV